MKRQVFAIMMIGVIALSLCIPMTSQAALVKKWNHGYNQSSMKWYNHYYRSDVGHSTYTIIGGKTRFNGPVVKKGQWSKLNIKYYGPYRYEHKTNPKY